MGKRALYTLPSFLWGITNCIHSCGIIKIADFIKRLVCPTEVFIIQTLGGLRVHWEDVNFNLFCFSLADGRHAVVEVEDVSLNAKLVDLPCVIGSLKTIDNKTFYKTADISQVWTSFLNILALTSLQVSLSPSFSLYFTSPFHFVNGDLSFLISSSIA